MGLGIIFLAGLLVFILLPWIIVGVVYMVARDHFRKMMPVYIGGAFVFEILLFVFAFGVGMFI